MPRNIDPSVMAQLQTGSYQPAFFVMLTFATTAEYFWTGSGNILFNGITWQGIGTLLGISNLEDSASVEPRGITVTLSGIDATLLPLVMNEFKLGLPAAIYMCVYYPGGGLIDFPITSWSGNMGDPTIRVTGTEATIEINCESKLIDLNIPCPRRLTQEDQQSLYPGDLGMQFITSLTERQLFWGSVPRQVNTI